MAYNQFDIVVVPFPFTDTTGAKRRPAVVLSDAQRFNIPSAHSICLMITTTTSSWPFDLVVSDLTPTGLKKPCKMRMKIFTIDTNLIAYKAGSLAKQDQDLLKVQLGVLIP